MHYNLTLPIFYSDVCLIFIVTGIICAVVRWFHMCRPTTKRLTITIPHADRSHSSVQP